GRAGRGAAPRPGPLRRGLASRGRPRPRSRSARRRRRSATRVQRGECATKLLGLAEQLVKALLDLFTEGVDHFQKAPGLVVGGDPTDATIPRAAAPSAGRSAS